MANYMDGMEGGKHNSDNTEASFSSKKKITRANVSSHLLEYQLNMVGKSMTDLIDDDKWRFNITMTNQQLDEFTSYGVKLLQKVFRFNKRKAVDTFEWFRMQFGLRIKD